MPASPPDSADPGASRMFHKVKLLIDNAEVLTLCSLSCNHRYPCKDTYVTKPA